MNDFVFVLSRQLESGGWFNFIARGFGWVINLLFNLVQTLPGALGISIILMTILFRFLILPLHLKSQRSMLKMRELKPELDKIKAKYGNSKDPELMRKSQQEQQALLAKHGANPLSGCLPMLTQMPLFIGLNTVMRQAAFYMRDFGLMYERVAAKLLDIPGMVAYHDQQPGILQQIATGTIGDGRIIPEAWERNLTALTNELRGANVFYTMDANGLRSEIAERGTDVIVMGFDDHLARVISRFTDYDWDIVWGYLRGAAEVSTAQFNEIYYAVADIATVENFLGVNVVERSGFGVIAVLTGLSMLASSWIMQQKTADPNADERARMMQKMMLFVMPAMMAFFTVNLAAAVGIFWITGQVFQIVTDIIFMRKHGTPFRLPFMKPAPEPDVVDAIPSKRKGK